MQATSEGGVAHHRLYYHIRKALPPILPLELLQLVFNSQSVVLHILVATLHAHQHCKAPSKRVSST